MLVSAVDPELAKQFLIYEMEIIFVCSVIFLRAILNCNVVDVLHTDEYLHGEPLQNIKVSIDFLHPKQFKILKTYLEIINVKQNERK